MSFSEDFLHFVWANKLMDTDLALIDGRSCKVISSGEGGNHDGPDFVAAKLIVDSQIIVGNVEIHLSSSDWFKHNHDSDPAYGNVILHVVVKYDLPVFDICGKEIPTLILNRTLIQSWYKHYVSSRFSNSSSFSCSDYLSSFGRHEFQSVLYDFALKRLERKQKFYRELFISFDSDWFEFANYILLRAFGLKINTLGMELLARQTSAKIIAKESFDLLRLESLLLGQAGLLENLKNDDAYCLSLISEYSFLKSKHNLTCIDSNVWKYAPVRPPAMPDLRLALYASLVNKFGSAFSFINSFSDGFPQLDDVLVSGFWKSHCTLSGKIFSQKSFTISKTFLNQILINAVIPFYFVYGSDLRFEEYKARAVELLSFLPPETNRVTKMLENADFRLESALETQGFLELHETFCLKRLCMSCEVMKSLLSE